MTRIFARNTFLIIFAYSLITARVVLAEDRDLKIIISGFEDYKAFGNKKALHSWLKFGPQEDTDYSASLIEILSRTEKLYGDYKSYEVLKKYKWSNNVTYFFIVINYEKGPLFAKFMLYNFRNDNITYAIQLDTNPEIIIPEFYFNRTAHGGY